MKKYNVAIMGSTGVVGTELLNLLGERNFPLNSLKLLASKRSTGKKTTFRDQEIIVEELMHNSFEGVDIVLASAGGLISKKFAPSAVKAGAVVIDNTSFYRMHSDVPLVIPEINPEAIKQHKGIIANPNCSTIIMALPLIPLHKAYGIKRIVVSTYQAASGAGAQAMQELKEETEALLTNKDYTNTVINQPYAFNLFPHNSPMQDNGYVEEEIKMIKEINKIFNDNSIKIHATCIRVPIMRAHSETVNIEFKKDFNIDECYKMLAKMDGVKIFENRQDNLWATPLNVSGKDAIYVGRLRRDISQDNTLDLWIVGDQIRKGAALNAIQIAEKFIEFDA